MSLGDQGERSRSVFHRFGEDLEQIPFVITIDQNSEFHQFIGRLIEMRRLRKAHHLGEEVHPSIHRAKRSRKYEADFPLLQYVGRSLPVTCFKPAVSRWSKTKTSSIEMRRLLRVSYIELYMINALNG